MKLNTLRALFAATVMLLAFVAASAPVTALNILDTCERLAPGDTCDVHFEADGGIDCATFYACSGGVPSCQDARACNGEVPSCQDLLDENICSAHLVTPTNPCGPDTSPAECLEAAIPLPHTGGGLNVCSPGMFVCAMAGADSHWEKVTSGKVGVMMTMGGGQSGNIFPGYADVQSTLGSGQCSFDAWSGCLLNWQDIRTSCFGTMTDTDASAGLFSASSTYQDPICETK